ncbi:MAG: hypothetical protein KDD33_08540, partial [Bdellovibrionales bacterium]|nr:hypothetical protein [Bdellovibrionales bacterium]
TPPTSLGKVFGVEAAIIAGAVESPGISQISKQYDPNSDIAALPHAWLLAGISVPFGVSIELNFLPSVDVQDIKMSHNSLAVKWSITDQFFAGLPFDWSIRSYYTKSELSYRQTIVNGSFPGSITSDVGFENTMVGGDSMIGIDFGIVEPYAGVGFVNTKGELRASAVTATPYSIFDDGVSQSLSSKQNSARLIAGMTLHLTALKVGVEYSRLFGVNRVSAKLGLAF